MNIIWFEVSVTPVLLLTITAVLYVYCTWNHNFWKKRGIPGPKPLPIFGNLISYILKGDKGSDAELVHKYGKIVGLFRGSSPWLLVSDFCMIKQMMVKDSHLFVNRFSESLVNTEYPVSKFITLLRDDHWKRVRNALSPAFSGSKLKKVITQINDCADELVQNLLKKAESGESFEIGDFIGAFAMDTIVSVGFGLQIDTRNDPENPFVKNAKKAFTDKSTFPAKILLLFFPKMFAMLSKFLPLNFFPAEVMEYFASIVQKAIEQRKEYKHWDGRADFLQHMLDVQIGNLNPEKNNKQKNISIKNYQSVVFGKHALTHDEIVAQSIFFLLASYGSTVNALIFLAYNLAINPECQKKLQEEIESIVGGKEKVTYDMVHQMPYMDMCIQESMRLFPAAVNLERVCAKDTMINGVFIPKECVVSIPVYTIHHDPEIWPDPEKFKPERFTAKAKAERDQYCYLPFSIGPRQCLGMRLALMNMKVVMAKMLHKIKLTKCSKTEIPVHLCHISKGGVLHAKNRIYLSIELH